MRREFGVSPRSVPPAEVAARQGGAGDRGGAAPRALTQHTSAGTQRYKPHHALLLATVYHHTGRSCTHRVRRLNHVQQQNPSFCVYHLHMHSTPSTCHRPHEISRLVVPLPSAHIPLPVDAVTAPLLEAPSQPGRSPHPRCLGTKFSPRLSLASANQGPRVAGKASAGAAPGWGPELKIGVGRALGHGTLADQPRPRLSWGAAAEMPPEAFMPAEPPGDAYTAMKAPALTKPVAATLQVVLPQRQAPGHHHEGCRL